MTVFIGADHRGFELKNKLIEYLQNKEIRVEDMGNYEYDPHDDFPDYANKVAEAILQNKKDFLGIVICGSGVGVSVAANRHKGVYCALGFSMDQVEKARQHDHINMLALPADYLSEDQVKNLVDRFLTTEVIHEDKYMRRLQKIDNLKEINTPQDQTDVFEETIEESAF